MYNIPVGSNNSLWTTPDNNLENDKLRVPGEFPAAQELTSALHFQHKRLIVGKCSIT
jgi:hypothetical protein